MLDGERVSSGGGSCVLGKLGIAHALRNPNVQKRARNDPNTQVHP